MTVNQEIYNDLLSRVIEINKKYNLENTSAYPTPQWVAGKFTQLHNIPSMKNSLDKGLAETNPQLAAEYERMIALGEIGEKYGLVKSSPTNRGGVKIQRTNKGSKFIQELSSSFNSWKDTSSIVRDIAYNVDSEWYDSLSSSEKTFVDIYKSLSAKEYAFLMGLIDKQSNKKRYTDYLHSYSEQNPDSFLKLQHLNLVKDDYTINHSLVKKWMEFLTDKTYPRLKSFNKDISYITDRISADKALLRNYLERNIDRTSFRRSDLARDADIIIDTLSSSGKSKVLTKYLGKDIRVVDPELLDLKIISNDGSLTELGTYIAVVLRKLDRISDLESTGEKPTQYSRISGKDSGRAENKLNRKRERAGTRSTSFKDFLGSK